MLTGFEPLLIWFCLTLTHVLAGPVDVTPRTLSRRYPADFLGTTATVSLTAVNRICSVNSSEQRADSQPASRHPSGENYTTTHQLSVPGVIDFQKEYILWDETCTSNRTEALKAFFNEDGESYNEYGIMWRLIDNSCFAVYFPYPDDASSIAARIPLPTGSTDWQPGWSTESDCGTLLPPESSSVGSSMLRWMREPECLLSYDAYKSLHAPNFPPYTRNNQCFQYFAPNSWIISRTSSRTSSR